MCTADESVTLLSITLIRDDPALGVCTTPDRAVRQENESLITLSIIVHYANTAY